MELWLDFLIGEDPPIINMSPTKILFTKFIKYSAQQQCKLDNGLKNYSKMRYRICQQIHTQIVHHNQKFNLTDENLNSIYVIN